MKSSELPILAAAFAISLTGCGGSDNNSDADYPNGVAPIDEGNPAAEPDPTDGDAAPDTPPADAPDAAPDTRTAEGLVYTVPDGWTVGGPRQMRVRLPSL